MSVKKATLLVDFATTECLPYSLQKEVVGYRDPNTFSEKETGNILKSGTEILVTETPSGKWYLVSEALPFIRCASIPKEVFAVKD